MAEVELLRVGSRCRFIATRGASYVYRECDGAECIIEDICIDTSDKSVFIVLKCGHHSIIASPDQVEVLHD